MQIWNNILKFDCEYQQNGDLKENFNWNGYIICNNLPYDKHCGIGLASTLEGVIVDNQIKKVRITELYPYKQYTKDFVDERYLFGPIGMYHKEGIVKFVIFPLDHAPIDYEFKYDEEDDCLYGVYYFAPKEMINNNYSGFAKLKIIQDFDEKIDEKMIDNKVYNLLPYYQHLRKISQMTEFKKNSIQIHDENDEKYIKAKEYFKAHNKVLKLNYYD